MSVVWITSSTLFVITLGFAGLLGELIHHLRIRRSAAKQNGIQVRLAGMSVFISILVLLFPLSLPGTANWLLWLAAVCVIAIYALHRRALPPRLLTRRFAWRYTSAAMLLSAWWNFSTGTALPAGTSLPATLLAVSALLAALLAWLESRRQQPSFG